MMWTKIRFGLSIFTLGMSAVFAGEATAGVTELMTDRFGYAGSYTKYGTLADALANTNAIATGVVNQRDMSLSIVKNSPSLYNDSTYITTAWFYTTTGPGYGDNNPNNTNLSFLQIANDPNVGLSPLIGTADAYWTSPSLNEFHITASGAGATQANSAARFGDTNSLGQPGTATFGEFLSYNLNATFSGLNTALYNVSRGAYESTGDPNGISVAGSFTALFHNTSSYGPSNGYYAINLTFNTTSWAYNNRNNLNSVYPFSPSLFGASTVVPEPSSLALAGFGVLGVLAGVARRRRAA